MGKTAIYRRYSSKEELAASAAASIKDDWGPPPDTGNARQDIVEMLVQAQAAFEHGPVFPMLGALLVEEAAEPGVIRAVL